MNKKEGRLAISTALMAGTGKMTIVPLLDGVSNIFFQSFWTI